MTGIYCCPKFTPNKFYEKYKKKQKYYNEKNDDNLSNIVIYNLYYIWTGRTEYVHGIFVQYCVRFGIFFTYCCNIVL